MPKRAAPKAMLTAPKGKTRTKRKAVDLAGGVTPKSFFEAKGEAPAPKKKTDTERAPQDVTERANRILKENRNYCKLPSRVK